MRMAQAVTVIAASLGRREPFKCGEISPLFESLAARLLLLSVVSAQAAANIMRSEGNGEPI